MTKWVRTLLIANVVMFLVTSANGAVADALAFYPPLAFVRPWTAVTYMFLHAGFMHIFGNMIGLFFFGSRVEMRLGSKRFLWLYFIGGISGAIFSFVFAPHAAVIGASAGVFGIMLAFAMFWPHDEILIWGIIPVKAWLMVAILTVFTIYSGLTGSRSGVADFAHLGGYVGAYLYLKWLDATQGAKRFKAAVQPKVADRALLNWKKVDPRAVHEVNRDELNRILDKVSKSGLGSLTPDERRFLMSFVPPDDRPPVS